MFLEHPSLVCILETHVLWSLILHRYAAVQRVSYRVLESQLEDGVMDGYSGHSPIERMMHLSWREARRVCFDDGVDGTPSKSFATRIFGVGVTVRTVTLGHFSKIGFLKLAFFEQLFHGYLHNQGVAAINANCIYNLLLVSFYIYTQMQKERYISSV